ncbi:MAG: hypothetical protein GY913_32185 [Proteobacteria bacterium]|nr:hypothetical protein [Pseudomonadota bacterium]MCP4921581.1 hypothetical protein [Pseudomonadota bacterium]
MLFCYLMAMSPPPEEPEKPETPAVEATVTCKTLTIDGGNEAGKLAKGHTQVDATRLSEGEVGTVGPAVDEVRGLALAEALLTSNTILSWIHIGSELCLTEVEGGVHVKGTHTYFTNEENVVPIEFDVRVDEAGLITVVGR